MSDRFDRGFWGDRDPSNRGDGRHRPDPWRHEDRRFGQEDRDESRRYGEGRQDYGRGEYGERNFRNREAHDDYEGNYQGQHRPGQYGGQQGQYGGGQYGGQSGQYGGQQGQYGGGQYGGQSGQYGGQGQYGQYGQHSPGGQYGQSNPYGGQHYSGNPYGGGQYGSGQHGGYGQYGSSQYGGGQSYGSNYGPQGYGRSGPQPNYGGGQYGSESYGQYGSPSGYSRYGSYQHEGSYGTRGLQRAFEPGGGLEQEWGNDRGQYRGQSQSRGRGPRGYTRSDERIKEDVSDRLGHSWIDAGEVEVTVSNGEVTLSGTVRDRREKHEAENIAESISGVKEINNQIRVKRGDEESQGQKGSTTGSSSLGGSSYRSGANQTQASQNDIRKNS